MFCRHDGKMTKHCVSDNVDGVEQLIDI